MIYLLIIFSSILTAFIIILYKFGKAVLLLTKRLLIFEEQFLTLENNVGETVNVSPETDKAYGIDDATSILKKPAHEPQELSSVFNGSESNEPIGEYPCRNDDIDDDLCAILTKPRFKVDTLNDDSQGRFYDHFKSLPANERSLLWRMAAYFELRGPVGDKASDFMPELSEDDSMVAVGKLIDKGLAVTLPADSDDGVQNRNKVNCLISPSVAETLFKGLGRRVNFASSFAPYGSLIKASSMEPRRLFYNDDISDDIKPKLYDKVMQKMSERGKRGAYTCLLFGAPGTGKTELAIQAARESCRDMFKTDISKLVSPYVGQSEQNFRALFLFYRYAAAILSPAPILLFNEADSFLSTRVNVFNHFDKYENNLQNIILEEMENFSGILIATTNLTDNIDKAYDRRFFIKIEIPVPNANTRRLIWAHQVPDMPEDLLQTISNKYSLTGADIETIATRFYLNETFGKKTRKYSELEILCEKAETKRIGRTKHTAGFKV
jgi:hypothetical protein